MVILLLDSCVHDDIERVRPTSERSTVGTDLSVAKVVLAGTHAAQPGVTDLIAAHRLDSRHVAQRPPTAS